LQQLLANLRQTVSQGHLEKVDLSFDKELSLYLLAANYPRGRLAYDEMMLIINQPAYWAFCWASGQVLAAQLLRCPDLVKDQSVLDFGSGSGVVAIAAKLAGARRVIACDSDAHALQACQANAKLNKVHIELLEDLEELNEPLDVIIAADVLYDRDNFSWIERLPSLAYHVLIADSRVKTDELNGYDIIQRISATTIPDLDEFREFNDVRIYQRRRQTLP